MLDLIVEIEVSHNAFASHMTYPLENVTIQSWENDSEKDKDRLSVILKSFWCLKMMASGLLYTFKNSWKPQRAFVE